jgi:hypothetical protein
MVDADRVQFRVGCSLAPALLQKFQYLCGLARQRFFILKAQLSLGIWDQWRNLLANQPT